MRDLFRVLSALLILLACAFSLAGTAHADMEGARSAYAEGRWRDAAEAAAEEETAQAQAYAAGALISALLVEADPGDRRRMAREAVRYAERALRLDPDDPVAKLRLAAALGLHSRHMSPIIAYLRRMPQRGRALIQEALEAQPEDAATMALLGAWHLEVMRQAPEGALDASIADGLAWYRAARAAAPEDLNIAYHFALGLAALGLDEHEAEARAVLDAALQITPRDAYERGLLAEAGRLDAAWADAPARLALSTDRLER